MKRVAVMQPYLFPYVGYFQLIREVDVLVVLDDVQMPGRGFVNRNRLIINGAPRWFTLPVEKAAHREPMSARSFLLSRRWSEQLIGNIRTHYQTTQGRKEAVELAALTRPEAHKSFGVVPVNVDLLRATLRTIGQRVPQILLSSAVVPERLAPSARLIRICQSLGADTYLNLPGGKGLYRTSEFSAAKLRLSFINPHPAMYSQAAKDFQPWMSILDVIANTEDVERERVLSAYTVESSIN